MCMKLFRRREDVRTSRSGRRLSVVGGSPAAGSTAADDLLSIMYWVDDIVAEYVASPQLPGRDRVITRATALRADCRKLAEDLSRSAGLPSLLRAARASFPRPSGACDPAEPAGGRPLESTASPEARL